ncbi:unnamed protein product [Urochloa decumbens]|uniref:Uncharacterized protein n=1 Tax=Urochloa decumbens TaxID=240449 RepID=A0ABC9FI30_9POAL
MMSPSVLAVALLLCSLYAVVKNRRRSKSKLPPSPPWRLPLLGHLHHLIGRLPHRSLHDLHLRYGGRGKTGLLLLQLGRRRTLVVSTAAAAADLFKHHDLAFSSRPHNAAAHKQTYGSRNVSFAPYGEHWRQAKRVVVVHLLSARRVDAFAPVRAAEAAALVSRARRAAQAGEALSLRELVYGYTNAVVTRAAAGAAGATAERIRRLMAESETLAAAGFQADGVLPDAAAAVFRRVTGLEKKIDGMVDDWDRFLSEIIAEHEQRAPPAPGQAGGGDIVDVLLQLRRDQQGGAGKGFELTDDAVKAITKDMIAAATETTAVTLEWAMAELARNPRVMRKLQDEIARVAGAGDAVAEADLSRMGYLRAVIKEVLRVHPPAPLLIPRESMADAALQGGRYEIPAGTTLLVNAWAIGRDPAAWDAPEEFRPERFLAGGAAGGGGSRPAVDFRGTDYQLLPFGAGRRICPGINFAQPVLELALASLLRHFDWELPAGVRPDDMDMVEAPGLSAPPRVPLVLVPKSTVPYSFSILYLI